MKSADAALALLALLQLPAGAANVLVWTMDGNISLRVWVDARYVAYAKASAPSIFEGFEVVVEPRPSVMAH